MALQVSSYVISPFLSMSRNENTLSSSCTVGITGVFIFGSTSASAISSLTIFFSPKKLFYKIDICQVTLKILAATQKLVP